MRVFSKAYPALCAFLLFSCQSLQQSYTNKSETKLEVEDILEGFKSLPKETQKAALENGWTYFTYAFNFNNFQSRLLMEFPSLKYFGSKAALLGRTPLDLRLLNKSEINAAALLLAIDLEMEILSRFHSNQHSSPRCLEDFWSEWGLPISKSQLSKLKSNKALLNRGIANNASLEGSPGVPLNESSNRLAIYLKQSLGLGADSKLKLLSFEDSLRAQFLVNNTETYEIFSSPSDCKSLQEKKFLIPLLGKMRCLQKQSATWISVASKESTVVSDDWVSEVKHRCQKWVRPLSEDFRKDNLEIRNSALARSWSLYPRLRKYIQLEADRYEASFRKAL